MLINQTDRDRIGEFLQKGPTGRVLDNRKYYYAWAAMIDPLSALYNKAYPHAPPFIHWSSGIDGVTLWAQCIFDPVPNRLPHHPNDLAYLSDGDVLLTLGFNPDGSATFQLDDDDPIRIHPWSAGSVDPHTSIVDVQGFVNAVMTALNQTFPPVTPALDPNAFAD